MLDQIAALQAEAEAAIAAAADEAALEEARIKYVGRNGLVRGLFQKLGSVPKEDKPAVGQALNALSQRLEGLLADWRSGRWRWRGLGRRRPWRRKRWT